MTNVLSTTYLLVGSCVYLYSKIINNVLFSKIVLKISEIFFLAYGISNRNYYIIMITILSIFLDINKILKLLIKEAYKKWHTLNVNTQILKILKK